MRVMAIGYGAVCAVSARTVFGMRPQGDVFKSHVAGAFTHPFHLLEDGLRSTVVGVPLD
ncbi:hypothetical protein FHW96_004150 [Novosphingobium sp. SG751A]|nr:hypothetical protein [Novosphingobium sp. SG751A]